MNKILSLLVALGVMAVARAQSDSKGNDHSSSQSSEQAGSQTSNSESASSSAKNRTSVPSLNKASNLIGAEVRDADSEKIGEIKDVVLDFQSGRVAYVVVDAGDLLQNSSDKTCIAVPAHALSLSSDQQHLQIDVPEKRLKQLRTFSADNLPTLRSSSSFGNSGRFSTGTLSSQFADSRGNRSQNWRESQNRSDMQSDEGDDSDWYYYEWYLMPGDQESIRSHADYSSPNRSSGNSRGNFGQNQSGRYGESSRNFANRQRNWNGNSGWDQQEQGWNERPQRNPNNDYQQQYHGYSDENWNQNRQFRDQNRHMNDDDYTLDQSFHGRPSANSPWTAYDREYRQRHDYRGVNGEELYNDDESTGNTANWEDNDAFWNSSRDSQSVAQNSSAHRTAPRNSQKISGWVRDIDYSNHSFTVQDNNRTVQLKLADDATVKLNGQQNGDFHQLHRGERVDVGYVNRNGANEAFTVNERSSGNSGQGSSNSSQTGSSSNQQD